jgi:mRNA interferase MazF
MTNYKFGNIVLVAFPFTNLTQTKKRPALVLIDSNDNDIVVCRITSQICNTKYDVAILNWAECGLLVPSWIRLHKIATMEKTIINKTLGKLKTTTDLINVKETIYKLLKV